MPPTAAPAATLTSRSPVTGEVLAEYPTAGAAEVAQAVSAGRQAAAWWAQLSPKQRRDALLRWKRELVTGAEALAAVINAETGKPLGGAMLEIMLAVEHLDWAARNAHKTLRRRKVASGLLAANQLGLLEYVPLGVVGVIGPWNYPVYTPLGSISYALAAGNAVVFKPSEYTPGVGRWLAEAWARACPQPVLQTVVGDGATGAALASSDVDKVAFTGSAATARKVMAACAERLTPVVIEGGGKDALIVAADADIDAAATAAVFGGLGNAGQTCAGVERVYVEAPVYDRFLEAVKAKLPAVRPGDGPDAAYGPMTMPSQVDVVRRHVTDALERGAFAVAGGPESIRAPYIDPIVLAEVDEESVAMTEETFGPTLTVNKVRDLDEALQRANHSRYGLAGSIFTKDKQRGLALAQRLRTGAASINSVLGFAAIPALPFGGLGDSGFGRIHGADGLREFSRAKAVTWQRYRAPIDLMRFDPSPRAVRTALWLFRMRHGRGH
ncbi:aldehyde dehydrogenase [Rhizocola hellebori]|uniref:Aldehyde dehydrogenase n=1 Tax=Rhizocola hellebori TaxID=1392758 RepID=A0A8J3VE55_9ACTN|nr:aldehyde dehydrogenase family protein [Rhizocola hellebori]GIH03012.1 aldehyde dehydrogenase [Rhizocola hellebori]